MSISESRRWWDGDIGAFVEWTFEADPSRELLGVGGIRTRYQADGYDGIRNKRT